MGEAFFGASASEVKRMKNEVIKDCGLKGKKKRKRTTGRIKSRGY